MRSVITSLLLLLGFAATAHAWNKPGHMIVAGVAYDALKAEHPKTLAKALAMLRQDPEWPTFEKRLEAIPTEGRDEYRLADQLRYSLDD